MALRAATNYENRKLFSKQRKKGCLQRISGPSQQSLNRFGSSLHGLSNFPVTQVLIKPQDNRHPLLGWQSVQAGPKEPVTLLGKQPLVSRRPGIAILRQITGRFELFFSRPIKAQAAYNTVKVGLKGGFRLIPRGSLEYLEEGILHHIFGLFAPAKEAVGNIPGRRLMPLDDLLKGGQIAPGREYHKLFISRHWLFSRKAGPGGNEPAVRRQSLRPY
jgi:hypothetical protein